MTSRRASRCGNPRGIDAEFIRMIAHPAHRGLCVCNRVHDRRSVRSEEHTSELQSLMRISYAVFCLKKKNTVRERKLTDQTIERYDMTANIDTHSQHKINNESRVKSSTP